VRELIARMSRELPLWGSERIRGELLKLGITASNRSIRRYRWRGPARPPRQAWRTFLRNHGHAIWAADLFVVRSLTFKTLYVLVLIAHVRRELVHPESNAPVCPRLPPPGTGGRQRPRPPARPTGAEAGPASRPW
jgi:hypothetical protein